MPKKWKNKIYLIFVLMLIFTVLNPLGAYASDVEVLNIPVVDDDKVQELGTVYIRNSAGQIMPGDTASVRLPEDFKFMKNDTEVMTEKDWNRVTVDDAVYEYDHGEYFYKGNKVAPNAAMLFSMLNIRKHVKLGSDKTYFEFPVVGLGTQSGLFNETAPGSGVYKLNTGLHIAKLSDNEIEIEVNDITPQGTPFDDGNYGPDSSYDVYMFFRNGAIYIDEGFEGYIQATIDAPSTSGISSGIIPIGRVSGGEVDLEVTNAPNFNNDTTSDPIKIRIKEDRAGAIADGESSAIKFVLPDGFEWTGTPTYKIIWGDDLFAGVGDAAGDNAEIKFNTAKDELKIDTTNYDGTNNATLIELTANIECVDETDAEYGDVVVKVKGESTTSVSELVVARYGDYDATISAGDAPTIYAGQLEQEIAKIKIEEAIAGSMIANRTLLLTLPEGAKWAVVDDDNDHGLYIEPVGFPGRDGKTAKFKFTGGSSSDAAELELKDMEVMVEPGFEGDLVVEVSGSAGLSGELTVAKVVPAVKVTAEVADGLVIGRSAQAAGTITITEADAGLVIDGKDLIIDLPRGVRFVGVPDVQVTEGDLEIDDYDVKDDTDDEDNLLVISIKDDSNEASTIEISGIEYVLDRTVPEGDIEVVVRGDAINEVNDDVAVKAELGTANANGYIEIETYEAFDIETSTSDDDYYKVFPKQDEAAVVVNAKVGTPAPEEKALSTSITLGDNGSYISDGRIMVQLRDAAKALGVAEQNIFWDNATKTATFIKGDRVAQLTVGDPQVKLNGVALPTDKGAELKDGRTYVSLSAAGVALGATASWDNATKTATLTVK